MKFSIYNINVLYRWYRMEKYKDLQQALVQMDEELEEGHVISFKDISDNGISVELFKLYNSAELQVWVKKNLAKVA